MSMYPVSVRVTLTRNDQRIGGRKEAHDLNTNQRNLELSVAMMKAVVSPAPALELRTTGSELV